MKKLATHLAVIRIAFSFFLSKAALFHKSKKCRLNKFRKHNYFVWDALFPVFPSTNDKAQEYFNDRNRRADGCRSGTVGIHHQSRVSIDEHGVRIICPASVVEVIQTITGDGEWGFLNKQPGKMFLFGNNYLTLAVQRTLSQIRI
jgi:hypothetical protein